MGEDDTSGVASESKDANGRAATVIGAIFLKAGALAFGGLVLWVDHFDCAIICLGAAMLFLILGFFLWRGSP